jgi:hypothetical protein
VRLGLGFEGIVVRGILEGFVLRVPEVGIRVEGDLAVEGEHLAVVGEHERVDLDECRVLLVVHLVKLHEHRRDLRGRLLVEAARERDLGRLGEVDAADRVDLNLGERVRALLGELLDVHAALDAAQREVGAVGPIEQD